MRLVFPPLTLLGVAFLAWTCAPAESDLTRARLQNATLAGADLRDATLDGVNLAAAGISQARLDLAGA